MASAAEVIGSFAYRHSLMQARVAVAPAAVAISEQNTTTCAVPTCRRADVGKIEPCIRAHRLRTEATPAVFQYSHLNSHFPICPNQRIRGSLPSSADSKATS